MVFQLLARAVSELFFPKHRIRAGAGFGAELPGRFQVSLPRAVMLNESVEKIPRIRQAYPGALTSSKALRRSLAS